MRWMRGAPLLILLTLCLLMPTSALAVSLAPPGKSGASQYFETVPTSRGNAAPPSGKAGLSGEGSRALDSLGHGRAGATSLAKLGKSGQAAAALAAATAPSPAGGAGRSSQSRGRHGRALGTGLSPVQIQGLSAPAGGSTASALAHLLGGSDLGGLGLWLPLFLLAALVAVIGGAGFTLARRRGPAA